jgi:hypothetical protein
VPGTVSVTRHFLSVFDSSRLILVDAAQKPAGVASSLDHGEVRVSAMLSL